MSDKEKTNKESIFRTELLPLRAYCRRYEWPRLPQWHHWIYSKAPVAKLCVKKIGGRYLIDVEAFQAYVEEAGLEEEERNPEGLNKWIQSQPSSEEEE
jgi:hypothetical protein